MPSSYFSRVVLIPSTVFLSVMFGGAFGSGREVVEFISKHGPEGGFLSMATIAFVYSVCLFLCFELSRKFQAYEYRSFFRVLLGKGWFFYEIIIMLGLVVALAICASSAGSIFGSHFGIPYLAGGFCLLLIVVILNYFGREMVERSMIYAVTALAVLLLYLMAQVLSHHGDALIATFAEHGVDTAAISSGFKYGFSNAGFIPLLLYCCRDLKSRRESLIAGVCAGCAGIAPGIAFHLSFMVDYPAIINQELPTYWILSQVTSPLFLNIYVAVLFVMVAQTGVGLLQGVLERVDSWMNERRGKPLPPLGHALVSGGALIASTLLATMGLVELVVRGYSFFSAAFVLIFFIPLFTYGVYKIWFDKSFLTENILNGRCYEKS